ncbi:MAG: hypothetical protein HYY04_02895 [Chloroflexi bacterium]|nr:hypothetical protein [Chloroflexota bacterium]
MDNRGGQAMKVIQAHAEIGEDRILQIRLPEDSPTGPVEVLLVLEPRPEHGDAARRRAAADAGFGLLRGIGPSVDEFLAERREVERRRDEALGR